MLSHKNPLSRTESNRILISSLPLAGLEGGVTTVSRWAARLWEEAFGAKTDFIWNALSRSSPLNRGLPDALRGRRSVGCTTLEHEGHICHEVGRFLPVLEPLSYTGNLRTWRRIARGYPLHFGIGGSCHPAYVFARMGVPFVLWVSTILDEDKESRRARWGLPRRLADRFLFSPPLNRMERYIFHRSRRILSMSRYCSDCIVCKHGVAPEKIDLLPVPIDTNVFCPKDRAPQGRSIVFTARFSDARKNTGMLLRAFALAWRQIPELTLTIAGDAPSEDLLRLARQLGVAGQVNFPGVLDSSSLVELLQDAWVFALPSHQEGLCISALEAMACQTPVISTKCGGPEDYIADGENGFLTGLDSPESMAQRFVELARSPDLHAKLCEGARSTVVRFYSPQSALAIFKRVCADVYSIDAQIPEVQRSCAASQG